MTTTINSIIEGLETEQISQKRKEILNELITYMNSKNGEINLNFICTHNSRRSQFSQAWAFVLGQYFNLPVNSYSGGVEVTACNERTIASLKRVGFEIENKPNGTNPIYQLHFKGKSIELFSKLYDDKVNPQDNFAAIMTCSSADEGCPFIPGAQQRIPIRYEDPKAFDDTELESRMYDERSLQIATELKYVFQGIK